MADASLDDSCNCERKMSLRGGKVNFLSGENLSRACLRLCLLEQFVETQQL